MRPVVIIVLVICAFVVHGQPTSATVEQCMRLFREAGSTTALELCPAVLDAKLDELNVREPDLETARTTMELALGLALKAYSALDFDNAHAWCSQAIGVAELFPKLPQQLMNLNADLHLLASALAVEDYDYSLANMHAGTALEFYRAQPPPRGRKYLTAFSTELYTRPRLDPETFSSPELQEAIEWRSIPPTFARLAVHGAP